jgi:hypothetical protein
LVGVDTGSPQENASKQTTGTCGSDSIRTDPAPALSTSPIAPS